METHSSKKSSTKNESERVFENDILHFLSKNHIAIPLSVFYGGGIGLLFLSFSYFNLAGLKSVAYFTLGLLVFTLFEYLIHRFLYHLPSVYNKGHVPYVLHGIHHRFPRDKKRLVMPPVLSITIATLIFGINYWLFSVPGIAFTGGFLVGYASYLSVH